MLQICSFLYLLIYFWKATDLNEMQSTISFPETEIHLNFNCNHILLFV